MDWRILHATSHGPRSLREIAQKCSLTVVGAAFRIHKLVRRGYLTRTKMVFMAGNVPRVVDVYEFDSEAHRGIAESECLCASRKGPGHRGKRAREGELVTGILHRRNVIGACILSEGGKLLGEVGLRDYLEVDEDIFAGVVDAIRNVLRASLVGPDLRLATIDMGRVKLFVETGAHCYLMVLAERERSQALRTRMQLIIRKFEEMNRGSLEGPSGDIGALHGAKPLLERLVSDCELEGTRVRLHGI